MSCGFAVAGDNHAGQPRSPAGRSWGVAARAASFGVRPELPLGPERRHTIESNNQTVS
jgi:hypothetical protein